MGSSASSEQPPVNSIDQSTGAAWLQFNWASFGGGISTIVIICFLLIALYFALPYNRKANRKARCAEFHELLLLSSRHHKNHDYHREHTVCHQLSPRHFSSGNVAIRDSPDFSPGCNSSTRPRNIQAISRHPLRHPFGASTCRLVPHPRDSRHPSTNQGVLR